ncbi:PREDICTED: prickle-like protein 3 [Branchiostoma belcheri]|uniref:Prickle-like protein 3 n=1 Tax=Branchiostoma belcheri TaxID=7741 RepID=A0A6P5AM93_BRABE|nr:PREDICTED: prickle-like protein 3 [Branchiostoma belcheri]
MATSEEWTTTSGPRDDSGENLARKQDNGAGCLKCGDYCPGLELHEWRNCCTQCKCRREDHDVYSRDVTTLFGKLQISQDTPAAKGYAWVPPGISSVDKLEEYMNALPDDRVPRIGTSGERARQRNLVLQLPLQDFDEDFCGSELTDAERRDFKLFRQKRDYQSYGMGTVRESIERDMKCYKCEGTIPEGGIAVTTSHTGPEVCWHPGCFCCSTCQILLVDLLYFYRGSAIYCGRHYGESLHPRCYGCDELIFAGEYTRDMSKQQWHATHFNCFNCNNSLTGHRYVNRDTNHYCLKCYEKLFAFPCEHCGQKIGTDVKDLSFNNKHWHEQCFNCSKCKKSLVDQQFTQKSDKIYCAQCHKETFLGKCDGCNQHFDPGDKKMEYQGKNWHEKCFTCKECKKPVGTKSFIAKDDKVICQPCYEDKYAKKCEKCRKVISMGGITYKDTPWHKECFVCTHCKKPMSGERFTSKDNNPYCINCYGDLFAKKCAKCTKPITGLGGTKFITFENSNWHSDCFNCTGCKTSLVGKGFTNEGGRILCPDCTNQEAQVKGH